MKTDADLIEAGKAAVLEGLRLWHLDVRDPSAKDLTAGKPEALRWRAVIDEIHKSAGWGSSTPYPGNHVGEEWCGMFAARCWREAGINPRQLAAFWVSTARLYAWGHYKPFNQHVNPAPAAGVPRRLVAQFGPTSTVADLPFAVREGDIAVIGSTKDAPKLRVVGRHIVVITGIDLARGVILTVEGNGGGSGPDGKPREGIVVGERKIGGTGDHVMWIYRPAPSDLLAA